MNPMTPAPIAPEISRKVVKSGIRRAMPVTKRMSTDLMITDLSFFSCLEPYLKNGCCSTMSKAASI